MLDKITRGTTAVISIPIPGIDIEKIEKLYFTAKQRTVVITKTLEKKLTRDGEPTDPPSDPATDPSDPSTDPEPTPTPEPEVEADVKVDGDNVLMSLTEKETLLFNTSDRVETQIRYIDSEGDVFASDIVRYDVKPILYDTQISQ